MSVEDRKNLLDGFASHVGRDAVSIDDDYSSAMIFVQSQSQSIDVLIQFAEDSNGKPTITLEYALVAGEDLPIDEIGYSMHVINYATMCKQGIPDFILALRPGVETADGEQRLPSAAVMVVGVLFADFGASELIALFESRIQQAFGVKKALLELIVSVSE